MGARVGIPLFIVEYNKDKHNENPTTEYIFGLLNRLSKENRHLEDGKESVKRFFDFLLDTMSKKSAEEMITDSISFYLSERQLVWGMTQYDTNFYLTKVRVP